VNQITEYNESIFENIKHINEYGQEYWLARELQTVLEYAEWRNFSKVIEKAKEACKNSNNQIIEHFVDVNKTSLLPHGGERIIEDIELSRYACYLIVQNGDPKKKVIALGQTYFAVKTRQQELIDNYDAMSEDQKRLAVRNEIKEHNKALADAAHDAGVITPIEYATFQNKGYQGLYGGLTAADIKKRKELKKSENILDHMSHEELAANLFRATQTESKLRRENIQGKEKANATHYEVGKAVRDTIKELGGTMPEDLPKPEKSIKQLEKDQKKLLK
jgi:DNA-damage-inducible protein D